MRSYWPPWASLPSGAEAGPATAEPALIEIWRRIAVCVALIPLLATACGQSDGTVRGVVIDVKGSLDEVTSFTVLTEGEEVTFVPVDDGEYPFPLSHLREHQRTGELVLVTWKTKDGDRIAVRIDDG